MTTEIQIEVSMLVYAFVLGIFLRLISDVLESLRKILQPGKICTACMDVLYWMATAGAVYGLMYRYASGSLRGIIILVALSGLVFMRTIDRLLW